MQPLHKNAQEWFEKAEHDLATAKAAKSIRVYDTALFHCQQAAEKAIKGFLTFHDIEFEKNHNMVNHLKKAITVESSFELWQEAVVILTNYAVLPRYPGNYVEVNSKAYTTAFKYAKRIYDHALSVLPKDLHPRKLKAGKSKRKK